MENTEIVKSESASPVRPMPTLESMKEWMNKSVLFLQRAMVLLYELQLEDEKRARDSKYLNFKGFNSFHASKGTDLALKFMRGEKWMQKDVDDAHRICKKYIRSQLLPIAIKKWEGEVTAKLFDSRSAKSDRAWYN
jgi:hypothetical protein